MRLLFFITAFFFISCSKSYEVEESKAIEDISNEYLSRNDLSKIMNPPSFEGSPDSKKININSLDLRVYISDALMPISQVKEDDEWMFVDNNFNSSDSIIFYNLVNSEKFKELSYKEFDKTKLKLSRPYSQYQKYPMKLREDEEYTILKFSRVCFDDKRQNGIVVINYSKGFESGSMSGFQGALLIKKINDKWTYVSK